MEESTSSGAVSMATAKLDLMLGHLRQLCKPGGVEDVADDELLERFHHHGDEAAFVVLLQRHGPMVLGVCRRVLANVQDAEDAFQATFLLLSRNGQAIRQRELLAGWLYNVARRVALGLRNQAHRRRARERQRSEMARTEPFDDLTWQELRGVLEEELGELPTKYRLPLILCYLEGKTHDQAAHEIGCARTSLSSRLSKARDLLRQRMIRRGFDLWAGLVAGVLNEKAQAVAVPAQLLVSTTRAALLLAAGQTLELTAGVSKALAVADEVTKEVSLGKLKLVAVLLLGALTAGATALAVPRPSSPVVSRKATPLLPLPLRPQGRAGPAQRLDAGGDPLPEQALARLGLLPWRPGTPVRSIACAPDGSFLASVGGDPFVRLWAPKTGREIGRLKPTPNVPHGFGFTFHALALSRDGRVLAAAEEHRDAIHLWDAKSGKFLKSLLGPTSLGPPLALSPDSKRLASFDKARPITLLDVSTALALSPDGKRLASVYKGGSITIWDVWTARKVRFWKRPSPYNIKCLAFSPGGDTLLTGACSDGALCLWDVETGQQRDCFHGVGSPVAAAYSPDGKTIVSSSGDKTLQLWDVASGSQRQRIRCSRAVWSVAFSPDGEAVLGGCTDKVLRLWDVRTGVLLREFAGNHQIATTVAFSADGRTVAAVARDCRIRLWDRGKGQELHRGTHPSVLTALAFSPDGKTLASAGHDGTICLWDVPGRKERSLLKGHADNVTALAFAPDGNTLASVGSDHTARLWDSSTGQARVYWAGQRQRVQRVWKVAFSPNGRMVATGDGVVIHILDCATWNEIRKFEAPSPQLFALNFSPDGKTVLAMGRDMPLGAWEVATGERLPRVVKTRHAPFVTAAFKPDGSDLATVDSEPGAQVWQTATGKEQQHFNLKGPVVALAFSPDGRLLAFALEDFDICLWDLAGKREVTRLKGHHGRVNALSFSPDGNLLASAGDDTTILLWSVGKWAARPRPRSTDQR
jgi:RNA polymerase sigma factor (sigma-70 family)